jgi:hypothetical protein
MFLGHMAPSNIRAYVSQANRGTYPNLRSSAQNRGTYVNLRFSVNQGTYPNLCYLTNRGI